MSANVFKTFGPIGQGMGKVADYADVDSELFPVGLTGSKFAEWYWGTRYVNTACDAIVSEGTALATFDGGVVGGPLVAANDRNQLIWNGVWSTEVPPATGTGVISQVAKLDMFTLGFAAPNDKCLAFDGTFYYPLILISGSILVQDPVTMETTTLQFDSRIDSIWSGSPPNLFLADLFGKTVPVGWDISQSAGATGSAAVSAFTFTKDSDWPYT